MIRLIRSIIVACTFVTTSAQADLVAHYNFETITPLSDSTILDAVPNSAVGGPEPPLTRRTNGASYSSANAFGASAIGTALGQAGRIEEPLSGTNYFGFWTSEGLIADAPEWTVLFWANRRSSLNEDFLFYIGTSDGFGGSSAETYLYAAANGSVVAENFAGSTSSSRDMQIIGGTMNAGDWHQVGLVRQAAGMQLFVDGQLIGADAAVALNSLQVGGNSVLVFGGIKSISASSHRNRMLDGMIDEITIFSHALKPSEVAEQFAAVPEVSPSLLVVIGLSGALFVRSQFRRRQTRH